MDGMRKERENLQFWQIYIIFEGLAMNDFNFIGRHISVKVIEKEQLIK